MDRVLIVFDNVQFSGHLENTLRKLGYVTDVLQNEYNVTERVITFNPDIVVVRGTSARLSTFNVGKKLKDNVKFVGKVILIFNAGTIPDSAKMKLVKADISLEEPASALKIASAILNLETIDKTGAHEKLHKMAQDDVTFRNEEQSYLIQHNRSIEDELHVVRTNFENSDFDLTQIRTKLKNELKDYAPKQAAKIETYNTQIDKIDIDLKKGLSKRKTKQENKANRKEWGIPASAESQALDAARKEFTNELFKKKPS